MAAERVYACMKIYASATDPASLDPRRRHRRRFRAAGGGVRYYHPQRLIRRGIRGEVARIKMNREDALERWIPITCKQAVGAARETSAE